MKVSLIEGFQTIEAVDGYRPDILNEDQWLTIPTANGGSFTFPLHTVRGIAVEGSAE